MELNNLLTEIAVYRCKMNRVSKGKSLSDPDVIKLRQGLDSLIYNYLKAYRQQNAVLQLPERDYWRAEAV
ncbi:Spo0E like sporulation regulatory protein (modular protein) [Candidatus Desulfosporosinus infrequens]|uniref:Spo0E like sporulation regulatory protein (Modular protein) n=1 Tax=Candidatus Desulfosporosinus infrequens TaxID=2043169 RepID=A0A2U3LKB0_9FIRM|nr:Spo0E like sporulation regulatory protein (modular protein) [Candidatus Desulfosporosinus infrequens]